MSDEGSYFHLPPMKEVDLEIEPSNFHGRVVVLFGGEVRLKLHNVFKRIGGRVYYTYIPLPEDKVELTEWIRQLIENEGLEV